MQPYPNIEAPHAAAGYEFSASENEVIRSTASWTKQAGQVQIIFGGLVPLAFGVWLLAKRSPTGVQHVVSAVVALVVGIILLGAATRLRGVVETQGNDIAHMMDALKSYRRAFRIQVIVVCCAFALGLTAFILGAATAG